MKFFLSVFPENKPFRKSCKKDWIGNNYNLIFILSGQSYESKTFFKYRLYTTTSMLQICNVANKFKTLINLVVFV